MFASIFDRWKCTDNALIVGDFIGGIEGDIEINLLEQCKLDSEDCLNFDEVMEMYPDQNALIFQVDVCYGEFVRQ